MKNVAHNQHGASQVKNPTVGFEGFSLISYLTHRAGALAEIHKN